MNLKFAFLITCDQRGIKFSSFIKIKHKISYTPERTNYVNILDLFDIFLGFSHPLDNKMSNKFNVSDSIILSLCDRIMCVSLNVS